MGEDNWLCVCSHRGWHLMPLGCVMRWRDKVGGGQVGVKTTGLPVVLEGKGRRGSGFDRVLTLCY